MIPRKRWAQYGRPDMTVKGIVIHNTNNPSLSAEDIEKLMAEGKARGGCHFAVDHKEVRQCLPKSWSCFNTGKGFDFGNTSCIAVEICTERREADYLEAERKGIELIKELMSKHNLTVDNVYYHRDFDPTVNCPAQILKRYTKNQFINLLKEEKRWLTQ